MAAPKGAFYQQLGQILRKTRRERRLTQDRLAAAVGLSRTSITNIEKGRQIVPVHLLVKLAQTLNVSEGDLVPSGDSWSIADGIEMQLSTLKPEQREWAARVLARHTSVTNKKKESRDASSLQSRSEESRGTATGDLDRSSTSARRSTS